MEKSCSCCPKKSNNEPCEKCGPLHYVCVCDNSESTLTMMQTDADTSDNDKSS